LNRTPSWAGIESTLSPVIKTVQSFQLAENEMYDEYVYVKKFVTWEKVSQ
jgi:hypothetical protein